MSDTPDLSTPPPGIDLPSQVSADSLPPDVLQQLQQQVQMADTVQNIQWPFCIRYDGKPWGDLPVAAPSPEAAAWIVNWVVDGLNAKLKQLGYPPLVTATAGTC